MLTLASARRTWAALWAASLSLACAVAHADLMLFPTRVVFDKELRSAQVELVNQGSKPETYRISLVNRRMGESGEFMAITEAGPGEQFADEMGRDTHAGVSVIELAWIGLGIGHQFLHVARGHRRMRDQRERHDDDVGDRCEIALQIVGEFRPHCRLHDVGRSGWWFLIVFTVIGFFVLLYWLVKASDAGKNAYGEGPARA